jgi:hypothetical protein
VKRKLLEAKYDTTSWFMGTQGTAGVQCDIPSSNFSGRYSAVNVYHFPKETGFEDALKKLKDWGIWHQNWQSTWGYSPVKHGDLDQSI